MLILLAVSTDLFLTCKCIYFTFLPKQGKERRSECEPGYPNAVQSKEYPVWAEKPNGCWETTAGKNKTF